MVLTLFALIVALAISGTALLNAPRARRPIHVTMASVFSALGTVPLTLLAVFAYGRDADHTWMNSGPFPFGDLGSGPFALFAFLLLLTVAVICWGYVFMLLRGDWSAYPH